MAGAVLAGNEHSEGAATPSSTSLHVSCHPCKANAEGGSELRTACWRGASLPGVCCVVEVTSVVFLPGTVFGMSFPC
jgi:hypothetical protein